MKMSHVLLLVVCAFLCLGGSFTCEGSNHGDGKKNTTTSMP